MKDLKSLDIWFVTGSQHLYGEETLKQVAENSGAIVEAYNASPDIPVKVVFKPVLTTPQAVLQLMLEANNDKKCVGLLTWMHTFSPAKMWINGLKILSKPIVHLHTQFNRDIPWDSINMDLCLAGCAETGRWLLDTGKNPGFRRSWLPGCGPQ